MKALRGAAALRNLREQPLWRLMAADKAPVVLAILQGLLMDTEKTLPSSILHERLTRDLDQLRAAGEVLPQTAQGYLADWLAQGWLTRRFPAGASEEEYELATDTASALRFVSGMLKPRTTATESRLATVIAQLTRLAEETDANPKSRVAALLAERERIDREIEAVERGATKPLPADRALERAREVIALADELAGDFHSVRDEFDKLNRSLRQSLLENEGSRGDVLESMLLMEALDEIASRPFARQLESQERKFLLNLTGTLMNEGGGVHDVLQHFARSLKSFVQSREFLEHRRLHSLLAQAQQAALGAKDLVRPNQSLGYELTLTSSQIRSASQWLMHDPEQRFVNAMMADAPPPDISLDMVSELVRQSEIDFRTLKQHIRSLLEADTQVSIGQLVAAYPVEQGLGSVVGYVALGAKYGETTSDTEIVQWVGDDNVARRARIPTIFFLWESYVELAD
jgi:hypothetical protein